MNEVRTALNQLAHLQFRRIVGYECNYTDELDQSEYDKLTCLEFQVKMYDAFNGYDEVFEVIRTMRETYRRELGISDFYCESANDRLAEVERLVKEDLADRLCEAEDHGDYHGVDIYSKALEII